MLQAKTKHDSTYGLASVPDSSMTHEHKDTCRSKSTGDSFLIQQKKKLEKPNFNYKGFDLKCYMNRTSTEFVVRGYFEDLSPKQT